MSILTMRGPDFLVLYLVICAVALASMAWMRRRWMTKEAAAGALADPYLLAWARGGQTEAMRLAVTVMRASGALGWDGRNFEGQSGHRASWPLERAILSATQGGGLSRRELEKDEGVKLALDAMRSRLAALGLVESVEDLAQRQLGSVLLLAAIGLLGVVKIGVAWSTGHTNVGFLALIIPVFLFWSWRWLAELQSPGSRATIEDAQQLFGGLAQRAEKEQLARDDIAFLGASFGALALPIAAQARWVEVYGPLRAGSAGGDAGSSSCGSSSCSSSSCSSSSCGGGSCGGGCGGCGS